MKLPSDSFKESDMAELVEQHEAAATEVPTGDSLPPTTTAAPTTTMTAEEPLTTEVPRNIGEPVQVLGNRSRPESSSPYQRGMI